MDNVYDLWGRLVQGVLREDRIRQDALRDFSSCTDDSSSTTSGATPDHIFSSGRFIPRSSIDDWQKGMLQGGGSPVSVHEGINSDGLCFAVKEISLQDQGEESQETIDQLEQEISLLSQLEHENILPNGSSSDATIEKHFPNGDLYIGTFSGNVPHGSGKYLWTDGCVYEGEWKRGKASGKGKFSWPSGATFEGEFKSGRMEGSGTLIGQDGDTYRGTWSADRKHGYGVKHYSNGDYYEGIWKRNLQNGQGRYVWKNGKEYIGEWKNGVIHGRGVLLWANGSRYDGYWENSVPNGHGVFT